MLCLNNTTERASPVVRFVIRLTLLGAVTLLGAYLAWDCPLPFVKTWWGPPEPSWNDKWHRRHRIADWLVFTNQLKGMKKAEVIAMLGKPADTESFKSYSLVYLLGQERAFIAIDSEWLLIQVGSDGLVSEAIITSD